MLTSEVNIYLVEVLDLEYLEDQNQITKQKSLLLLYNV